MNDIYKLKGFIARDKYGYLFFHRRRPKRTRYYWDSEDEFENHDSILIKNPKLIGCNLKEDVMPSLTWDDDPIEVELIIKKI